MGSNLTDADPQCEGFTRPHLHIENMELMSGATNQNDVSLGAGAQPGVTNQNDLSSGAWAQENGSTQPLAFEMESETSTQPPAFEMESETSPQPPTSETTG